MPKKTKSPINSKENERVMVVARNDIFKDGIWHGLKTNNLQKYINLISTKHTFLPRGKVETDPRWQQIIPYLVFEYDDKIFVMKRKEDHTDKRLANFYSIGIGGHINKRDLPAGRQVSGDMGITEWARREFEEEIDYEGNYKTEFVGLLNDDGNDVGMVHIGLIIRVTGDSDAISVRDEHKSGKLVGVGEARKYYKHMETWSQIAYDFLNPLKTIGIQSSNGMSKNFQNTLIMPGILPDWVIEEYIQKGIIKIDPLEPDWKMSVDQVSMDFHLGGNLKLFRSGAYRFIDTRRGLPEDAMEEINLKDDDPFILEPGAFAIASTKEVLKLPDDILGRLEGKSSLARLGILVHSTAARFDPGWNGAPVLELGNMGPKPAILYCGMPICAFTFERLAAPVRMKYEGSRSDRYSGSKDAVVSRVEKNVNKR